jgi:hypothetical protein
MSNAEKSQPSEISLAEAADRISAMEGPPAQTRPDRRQRADAEVEQTEAALDYADETSETENEAADDYSSEFDGEDEADTGADDNGGKNKPLDPNRIVTVKIDGKTVEVPLKEALEGYQRQSDYSRNFNALKQEKQTLDAERAQLSQVLAVAVSELQSQVVQEPDWEAIHREDPINFPLYEKQWRDRQMKLSQMQQQQAQLQAYQQHQELENRKLLLDEGQKYLKQQFKEWADPEKMQASTRQIRDFGVKQGFTAEELAQVYDPRYVVILEKARRYDALQANRPKPNKSEGPRPMRAGSNVSNPQRGNDVSRMQMRLKASGSVNDAAALFGLMDSRRK